MGFSKLTYGTFADKDGKPIVEGAKLAFERRGSVVLIEVKVIEQANWPLVGVVREGKTTLNWVEADVLRQRTDRDELAADLAEQNRVDRAIARQWR